MSNTEITISDPSCFQPVESSNRAGVVIRGLTKIWGSGPSATTAVQNLNVEMYEGQVFALLGHNGKSLIEFSWNFLRMISGAGKSTTVSMLTGLYSPTKGDAIIDGYSIQTQMNEIYSRIGVCPQVRKF